MHLETIFRSLQVLKFKRSKPFSNIFELQTFERTRFETSKKNFFKNDHGKLFLIFGLFDPLASNPSKPFFGSTFLKISNFQ